MTHDSPVLFREQATSSGHRIGIATLNQPRSLNALNLAMIGQLSQQLAQWEMDSRIVAVWLEGAGERAFCAGGDVVGLYQAVQAEPDSAAQLATRYFSQEYRLDYSIHRYGKPILCWGNGIVMGGGVGLMAGASHRIVTETSRIAMPEISIGLFPDVGASWFLNQMPAGCGLYLGLTGNSLNAADARYLGLADHCIAQEQKAQVLEQLAALPWTSNADADRTLLTERLHQLELPAEAQPAPQVEPRLPLIQTLTGADTLAAVVQAILSQDTDDGWLRSGQDMLRQGSPLTAHLVWEQLRRGKHWSLGQALRQELGLAVHCMEFPDLREGIRALLVDKDRQPHWQFAGIEEVPAALVEKFFTSPWPLHEHPLLDI